MLRRKVGAKFVCYYPRAGIYSFCFEMWRETYAKCHMKSLSTHLIVYCNHLDHHHRRHHHHHQCHYYYYHHHHHQNNRHHQNSILITTLFLFQLSKCQNSIIPQSVVALIFKALNFNLKQIIYHDGFNETQA